MEIQTRREILEIWRATVDYSYQDGNWGGVAAATGTLSATLSSF